MSVRGWRVLLVVAALIVAPWSASPAGADPGAEACSLEPTGGLVAKSAGSGTYELYVPASLRSLPEGTHVPLLSVFHGKLGSGSNVAGSSNFAADAEQRPFIVAFPDAADRQWDYREGSPDVAFARAVVEDISATYCVDAARLFATGHSAGGFMAQRLACDAPQFWAAVTEYAAGAPIQGGGGTEGGGGCNPTRAISVGMFHGEDDAIVEIQHSIDSRNDWATRFNCPPPTDTPVPDGTFLSYLPCDEGAEILWRSYTSQNHGWPDEPRKSEMKALMWEFLMRHPHPGFSSGGLDGTPPAITITTPADAATYPAGQVVNAQYSCTDEVGGSGLAWCVGTVPSGSPIDTSTLGSYAFTVTSSDVEGNFSSKTVSYRTAYDTGWLNPSMDAPDPGGLLLGNGFEVNPTFAYLDDGQAAENRQGSGDRHRYFGYPIALRDGAVVDGIEVRLDSSVSTTANDPFSLVELSGDGGANWVTPRSSSLAGEAERTDVIGGPEDTWGREWSSQELGDASFRVRITSMCTSTCLAKTFFVEWVAVRVLYSVPDTTPPQSIIASPEDGATYPQGEVVPSDYSCADEAGGSGVASCDGTVPNGEAIDTSTLGAHDFRVIATDTAGNSSARSVTYLVVDATAPDVQITSGPSDPTNSTLAVLVFSGSDDNTAPGDLTFACSLDGSAFTDCQSPTTYVGLSLGPHSFAVRAADQAGNVSPAAPWTWTVQKKKIRR